MFIEITGSKDSMIPDVSHVLTLNIYDKIAKE
jgi:hypothetical protein